MQNINNSLSAIINAVGLNMECKRMLELLHTALVHVQNEIFIIRDLTAKKERRKCGNKCVNFAVCKSDQKFIYKLTNNV